MLSMRDCLDYCNLTDDEVALIAEHEDIPDAAAATIACGLVQTPEGVLLLTQYLSEILERAERSGDTERVERARNAWRQFQQDFPQTH
ncbi:hypothetical protein [Cognatazoarcus halotolerans]|uniref:hypothetical protein n=1 Tax=Cognatazoarcus halotolerans TaxID=2686016 RepID=UPI001358EDDC|nr:hypothetical protein [Cognatazoarcus halotolerans]MBX3679407.1 hypothetical protein [Rhodocyclaceae bacterium]MCB1900356.1 hypothetical protein [Rhodocyclaceae bacterium]MCP5311432.1 hypothetical protein [Zoogloeaceae bacterium]